jgi:Na+/melibiose symporter-like transporter
VVLLLLAAVMMMLFLLVERRAAEPILPLSLLRNDIFRISAIVSFLAGAGMFGAILFISLYVQGVLGQSATASGGVLTPTMLSVVVGSVISGQLISRWGRYRLIAVSGLSIAAIGMFLLTQMDMNTSMTRVILNMSILGFGLGTAMVLFTIVVQNAVDYRVMGVATSGLTFFRSIGSTLGTAIFGSFLTSTFTSEFSKRLPESLQRALPPGQLAQLQPEALLNAQMLEQMRAQFTQLGANGQALFNQFLEVIRSALAAAIHEVFFVGTIVMALAAVMSIFLREIPLRRSVRNDITAVEHRDRPTPNEGNP